MWRPHPLDQHRSAVALATLAIALIMSTASGESSSGSTVSSSSRPSPIPLTTVMIQEQSANGLELSSHSSAAALSTFGQSQDITVTLTTVSSLSSAPFVNEGQGDASAGEKQPASPHYDPPQEQKQMLEYGIDVKELMPDDESLVSDDLLIAGDDDKSPTVPTTATEKAGSIASNRNSLINNLEASTNNEKQFNRKSSIIYGTAISPASSSSSSSSAQLATTIQAQSKPFANLMATAKISNNDAEQSTIANSNSINNKLPFNGASEQPEMPTTTLVTSSTTATTFRPLITPTLTDMRRVHGSGHQRTFSSKHHHDHHWGPFFEEPLLNRGTSDINHLSKSEQSTPVQVGIHLGTEAFLNCRVGMLRDKTVMWVRKTSDKVSLLTVGNNTYSGDSRISIKFQYPNNWRLQINPVQRDDAGLYMCQVSTHPPRVFATNVTILAPAIRVVDEHGHEVHDRYYKMGSAIDLTCQIAVTFLSILPTVSPPMNAHLFGQKPAPFIPTVIPVTTTTVQVFPQIPKPNSLFNTQPNANQQPHLNNNNHNQNNNNKRMLHYDYLHQKLLWQKDNGPLPKDVHLNLSATPEWRNSRLSILVADRSHSGTYSCSLLNSTVAVVNVQVLNALLPGEMPAAVQHNQAPSRCLWSKSNNVLGIILIFYFSLLSAHIC